MSTTDQFSAANEKYVQGFGDKGSLSLPPGRGLIIVTCMDARIDPAAALGIKEGEAHIIRNAGGVAKDALHSVIISQQLLGTVEVAIIHHTDCGMLTFTTPQLRGILKERYPEANKAAIDAIDFHPFPEVEQSIKDDVAYLRGHELVKKDSVISGWVYDVKTGKVNRIV